MTKEFLSPIKAPFLTSDTIFNSAKLLNGLFRNGSCQTLDNSAFTALTYSNTDIPFGSQGCFTYTSIGSNETKVADDFLLMDANSVYLIEADLKQLTKVGNPLTYVGVIQYDVDGNTILPYHVIRTGDTTLAAPLTVGDTTISLTSATGWENAGSSGDRGIGFYTYKNAAGQLYDRSVNPYTRYVQLGMWNAGGISGNTITLAAPWAYANPDPTSGGIWPAGTKVSNSKDGLSYNYVLLTAVAVPTTQWTRYKAYIGGGVDLSGTDNNAKFRPGFHQAKLFILPNYSGTTGDKIGIGNIYVGKLNGEGRFLPDASVSTFMKTVVDDADAATARGTLGVTTELALKLNKNDATLDAIDTTISGTAVAVFVYDTRNDSDGGRTMRNAGYPASFSIIATATTVTHYKNTDTALTQIGQITGLSGVTSAFALNGWLFVGSSSGVGKYNLLNSLNLRKQYSTTSTPAIVSNSVNRITGVVLPAAAIDSATGLPVPTLYVGTMAGVSRVAEDDTVSNWTESGSVDDVYNITVIGDYVYFSTDNSSAGKHILTFPVSSALSASLHSSTTYKHYSTNNVDSWLVTRTAIHHSGVSSNTQRLVNNAIATNRGMTLLQPNTDSWGYGLHATITKDFSTGWLFGDVRCAWLCEGVAETLTATDHVTGDNSTFTSGVGSWTAFNSASISQVSGRLRVARNGANNPGVNLAISTEIGKSYTLYADLYKGSASAIYLYVSGLGVVAFSTTVDATGDTARYTFVATSTSHVITIYGVVAVDATYYEVDNVHGILVSPDRSYKNKPLTVNGSVVKSAVASGCDLMAYSSWTTSNYLREGYSSDKDFGTTSFNIRFWLKCAATAANEVILERDSPSTAQRFTVEIASTTSYISFTCDDNTTTRTATSSVAIDDGVWHFYECIYDGAGGVYVYRDGNSTAFASANGSALLTLNNATATFTVGATANATNPLTSGSLSRLHIGAGNPSQQQIKSIYETEKYNYIAGNQSLLAGTSNDCKSVAYDSFTGKYHVVTGDYYNEFKDLVRTNAIAGVWTSVTAQDNVVIRGA